MELGLRFRVVDFWLCEKNFRVLFGDPRNFLSPLFLENMLKSSLLRRFEPDMLAFTGCYYGGGPKEINELGEIRKRWKTLPVSLCFYPENIPLLNRKKSGDGKFFP